MGFLGNLISGAVKVVVSPIAIVKDAADVLTTGDTDNHTGNLIDSAVKDIGKSLDDLSEGDL